ncbi:hypothetical protein FE257_010066 [Aspergillus nanangensis]|uniref:Uncharacterized protein n=1 Tax=Aspergillus nanangensis TaxID=2582783 RepID=A0AAD4CWB3_ASPNN|nr:hypothetical protein FE257_010066 [Aspergillus nanangensis]
MHDSGPEEVSPTSKVQISKDIKRIFALPVQKHHEQYHSVNPNHTEAMRNICMMLDAAGPKVEHGVLKAKEILDEGVNPELMRHALGIYLAHSTDAHGRKIFVPPLKNHALFLGDSQRGQDPFLPPGLAATPCRRPTAAVAGEICTADTLQGPALLSYWRDDYDFNDSHYHWHMVFRGAGGDHSNKGIRVIDRHGERFLYTHSQMVARYETEGLCWAQPLVRPWHEYDDMLEHGFAPPPALAESYGGYPPFSSWFGARNPDMPDTPGVTMPRARMEEWRDHIYEAIQQGQFRTTRSSSTTSAMETGSLALTGDNCLDVIGGILDAQYPSLGESLLQDGFALDQDMYGNLHNYGLGKFAEMAYRDNPTTSSPYGLMISNFGAPRDPCFWPWYRHLQSFAQRAAAKYPQDLKEYRADVTLSNLVIRPQDSASPHYRRDGGRITTFLEPPRVDLLESKAKLGHEAYEWSVRVKSTRQPPPSIDNVQKLTLRFFIAAQDLMNNYRSWIEMDKVRVRLTDASTAIQVHLDTDSSVARKMRNYSEPDPNYSSPWGRYGWPQNMMLPVGKVEGMPFVAFCMATDDVWAEDGDKDEGQDTLSNDPRYPVPDPRGMGYPFNRAWTQLADDTTGRASIRNFLSDHDSSDDDDYPFITTSNFHIFRTTRFHNISPVPPTSVTWFNTIRGYFKDEDRVCMRSEYGYDLGNYTHVRLHGGAILDATASKRMPLQMAPYSQDNPDPEHPLWTAEMCENFRVWMLNGCPEGTEL